MQPPFQYTVGLNSVFFQPQCIVLVFCITQSMTKAVARRVRAIDIGVFRRASCHTVTGICRVVVVHRNLPLMACHGTGQLAAGIRRSGQQRGNSLTALRTGSPCLQYRVAYAVCRIAADGVTVKVNADNRLVQRFQFF